MNSSKIHKTIRQLLVTIFGILIFGASGTWAARVTVDTSFNPQIGGGNVNKIHVLADGKLIITGTFSTVNGESRPWIARLNADGSTDAAFAKITTSASDFGLTASAMSPDGKIYIGGYFTSVNGFPTKSFARLNANGTVDTTFTADSRFAGNKTVFGIGARNDGKIVVSGYFDEFLYTGLSRRVLQLNADGTVDAGIVSKQYRGTPCYFYGCYQGQGPTNFTALGDSSLLLIGNFGYDNYATSTGGYVPLAKSQTDGGVTPVSLGFYTGAAWMTDARKSAHDYIYAGGKFQLDPMTVNVSVKKMDSTLNQLPYNSATFTYPDGTNNAYFGRLFAFDNEYLLISYKFDNTTNIQNFLTMLKPNGEQNASVNLNPNGQILDFGRASRDAVYVGGEFTQIAGASRSKLVRLKAEFPAGADFEGDRKADISVFRPSNGGWYRLNSSNNQFSGAQFGYGTDKPVCADFDGDGKTDTAVYRPSDGVWYVTNSSDGNFTSARFGAGEDIPVAGDFDGDAKADAAVFRPSNGTWYILRSSDNQFSGLSFGQNGDVPAAADFDGDGKADFAVYRNGVWYLQQSASGFAAIQFGLPDDVPIPSK